jgi:hypothetical protein
MALTFQRNITGITKLELFEDYLAGDGTIGAKYESILWFRPELDLIKIKFTTDLDEDEVIHLDSLIAAYVESIPQDLKIFRYIEVNAYPDKKQPPKQHDYKIGLTSKLQRKDIFDQWGTLTSAEFHADENLNDLIVKVDFVYAFSPYGDVDNRTKTVTWYREDGTAHPDTKIMVKHYVNKPEMLDANRRRRINVIDIMMIDVRQYIAETMLALGQAATLLEAESAGIGLVRDLEKDLNTWRDVGDPTVITTITNADVNTHVFLDNVVGAIGKTIRQYMIDTLNTANNPGA